MDHYDIAQICLNGHCITSCAQSNSQRCKDFCPSCGQPTITACPQCGASIPGRYHMDGVCDFSEYEIPKYCSNCGSAYPWTEAAIQATAELLALEDNWTVEQTQFLVDSLPDLITNTPKTKLAIVKFKKLLSTASHITVEGIRQFAIDFGCELVKQQLGI